MAIQRSTAVGALQARNRVVRIRPQTRPDEDVGDLIEDPWRSFARAPEQTGCEVDFEDPEFITGQRESIYYVQAIQESTAMINADNLRCEYDASGQCVEVNPCYGDYRTPLDDDCLAPANQRASSSPIFVEHKASPGQTSEEEAP